MLQPSTPISVTQLTFAIKNQIETCFSSVSVQGEITNCKQHSSGHLYFDLKDREAKISAVLFKNSHWPLSRPLKEGDAVIIHGALSLYPPHGKYQIIVKRIELAGQGALLVALEKLKQELKERGWFDPQRKKALPTNPKRIGIVTSPTGAVIQDILHVLSRRLHGYHVILNPVRVQGESAACEIAQAIRQFNEKELADVLIVGRGGGSLEDLWAFNQMEVLQAIYDSKLPIISAVGHETDITLADFVADMRAPTPSAAAEIVSQESARFDERLKKFRSGLGQLIFSKLDQTNRHLQTIRRHPLFTNPQNLLATPYQKVDEAKLKIKSRILQILHQKKVQLLENQKQCALLDPLVQLKIAHTKLCNNKRRLEEMQKNILYIQKRKLESAMGKLRALSPKNVLKRGYSILFSQKENSIIIDPKQIHSGDRLKVVLSEGQMEFGVS